MTVHFVGAGPGAADLLTLRAAAMLRRADVVVYPGTYLDSEVLGHCRDDAHLLDAQGLDLDQLTDILTRAHHDGRDVVRLCSGDPSVYSAVHEQAKRLDEAGVPWDITPGVPAYAAAAALLGSELTVPEVAQSLVITRAQARSTQMPEGETLAAFARTGTTLALHLAIRHIESMADELVEHYGADAPVAVVYRASQADELVLRGTLQDIAGHVSEAGLTQAAVILVGPALAAGRGAESWLYSSTRVRKG